MADISQILKPVLERLGVFRTQLAVFWIVATILFAGMNTYAENILQSPMVLGIVIIFCVFGVLISGALTILNVSRKQLRDSEKEYND